MDYNQDIQDIKVLITQALPAEYVEPDLPRSVVRHVYTGVGKVNAAIRLCDALNDFRPDVVLNVGTAGSIGHSVGDIILCTHFIDRDLFPLADFGVKWQQNTADSIIHLPWKWNLPVSGTCNSGDSFVTTPQGVTGDVVDMEAYPQAQICAERKIPFLSVKYVTDVVGQNSVKHWEDKLADARRDLAEYFRMQVSLR